MAIAASTLRCALARSTDYFRRSQHPAGYWAGELESNATITAEYLLFRRLLGRGSAPREAAVVRQLLAWQVEGGWPLFYDGPPDLNATLESAVALQMAGLCRDEPPLAEAARVVRELGGLDRARVFTRIWLALLGALPWGTVPVMPPELMLLPDSFPLSIYRFASWARATIVPLLVVLARPPAYRGLVPLLDDFRLPQGRARATGLPAVDTRLAFRVLDGGLQRLRGPLSANPLRGRSLAAARQWILAHQEDDGGWGGIQPAMVYSTLALASLGRDEQAVAKGLAAIEGFGVEEDGAFRLQSCVSPGWDTPWVMLGLAEAGLAPDDLALVRAARWLLAQQSDVYGDWARRAPGVQAGGWPFEFANAQYPDTDDTALVLLALRGCAVGAGEASRRGLAWLLGMQNPDGGWAAFDRENTTTLIEQIPFCDFGEVLDPSSADVTAHVLEALVREGYGYDQAQVRRGLAYIWRQQEADGAWFGRWGVNYVYGTATVLMALARLGFGPQDGRVARAVNWLRARQNVDCGWGESCLSYTHPGWRGRGPSTASQTAWAALGLLPMLGVQDAAVQGGLNWLVERQSRLGTWDEPYFTGTGFPGAFYINYHEYRNYFPTLALARALRAGGEAGHAETKGRAYV